MSNRFTKLLEVLGAPVVASIHHVLQDVEAVDDLGGELLITQVIHDHIPPTKSFPN
jgi:hypothetical protein